MSRTLRLVLLVCVSCRPTEPTSQPQEPRVWQPDVRTLYRSYQDDSERYTGQTVQVELKAGVYLVIGSELHWYAWLPVGNPNIIFRCLSVPKGNSQTITVRGVCTGRERVSGGWRVVVKDCVVQSPR